LIQRRRYLDKLLKLKDQNIIKVITGVRRCGKSTLLLLFRQLLREMGVVDEQIISLNFEDIKYESLLEYHKMYDFVCERLVDGQRTYVFLDEVQNVPDFQKAVDSLFIKENVDLYITGSNARMLSGELATLLSGRYIEISMLPLSFREFFSMRGGEPRDQREAFNAYYRVGAFPYAAGIEDDEIRKDYLRGIYSTVLLKDIVARKKIADVALLESVIKFLFDNIGNIVSAKKIADSLSSGGRKTSPLTVDSYLEALLDSFILYRANRYDVRGKQHLKSLEKYYVVDVSLRHLLLGDSIRDYGRVLENIVYLELRRRGYLVNIGKLGELEIDFIATTGEEKIYYQVAASVLDPATFEREFEPLKSVRDHYPKFVLTMDELPSGVDGIKQVNIIDFLLEK
jgi:predicted AAA+ superfamily ATPase